MFLFKFMFIEPYGKRGSVGHRTETIRKFFPETWLWQLSEVGLVSILMLDIFLRAF